MLQYIHAHWPALALYALGIWIAFATLVNRAIARPTTPSWKVLLWIALIDLPAFLASRGREGTIGPVTFPLLTVSRRPGEPQGPGPLVLLVLLLGAGCATPSEAYQGARKVQGGSADALTASYEGWRDWDREYQTIIAKTAPTKQEMLDQLKTYREKVQARVDQAFGVARTAVQSMRRSLDAADAIKQGSFAAAIASIAAAFFEIGRLFIEFKIGVPAPKVAS
jgi:hypothetical protein